MTPEHKAAETALHVACDRIMRAETELHVSEAGVAPDIRHVNDGTACMVSSGSDFEFHKPKPNA